VTGRTFATRAKLPRLLVAMLASLALLAGLSPGSSASPLKATSMAASRCPTREVHRIRGWLHTCGTKIVDSHRHVVRPVSVSIWEMSKDSGRHPGVCGHWALPPSGSAANLGRWGFNSVLLYISWANVESRRPTTRGGHLVHHYNWRYLRALRGAIHSFARHGVKVILAMGNNRWSSAFTNLKLPNGITVACGSGMPPWLYRDGGLKAMVRAEKRFFNSAKLQRWFARAWKVVVHRYRFNRNLIGVDVLHEAYDLLVQPYPGAEGLRPGDLHLTRFYTRVGRAIHRANRHVLILMGDQLDWKTNVFAVRFKPLVPRAVYDFEFFAPSWSPQGKARMDHYWSRARRWHRPALAEEFFAFLPTNGSRPPPSWAVNARRFLEYARNHHIGWSYAPYYRLPNNPSGLLGVLQGGWR
jgi:cellulase (glycosyl hydrolase family 5)